MESILNWGNEIFAHGAVLSLTYALAIIAAAKFLQKILTGSLTHYAEVNRQQKEMFLVLSKRLIKYASYTIAAILIIYEILPLRSLGKVMVGLSGAATVIVAFAAQEFAGNLISGAVISAYQPFKVGDLIYLPQKELLGTVVDMNFRHVELKTVDNALLLIPNKLINETVVENRSGNLHEPLRNSVFYAIAYNADYQKARSLIKSFLDKNPLLAANKNVEINIAELAESAIKLRVVYYTYNVSNGYSVKYALNEFVLNSFAREGIEIPYPYLNIIKRQ